VSSPTAEFAGVTIVYVGDFNPYARTWARVRAFRSLGAEVAPVRHTGKGDPKTGNPKKRLLHRVAGKLRAPLDWEAAGRGLLATLKAIDPQIIWIDKGAMLRPEILAKAKQMRPGAVLVWFSEDDMFGAHNRTARFDRGLGLYDLVFTTKSYNADPGELPALGARRVQFVFQAFDAEQPHPLALTPQEQAAYGGDLGFIGSYELERAGSMLRLAEAGLSVRVWGNLWDRCPYRHANLRIEGRPLVNLADDLAYSKGIAATRINLCFLRKINRDRHTSRTFEIPAVGGFMLGERTEEHVRLFEEGVEAEFFGSDEELVEKAAYYLAHEAERRKIAAAGHARCQRAYDSRRQAQIMLAGALSIVRDNSAASGLASR
jgi:spore maturation protein CgeB